MIRAASESEAEEVEIEEHGVRIVVRKNAPSVTLQPPVMLAHYPQPLLPPATASDSHGGAVPAPPQRPAPQDSPEPESATVSPSGQTVEAPTPGTYYSAPSPDAEPFVSVGDKVEVGDTLCIIEAMKLMNEIECEAAGTIVKVFVKDSEPVEYGQALFVIDPA